MVYEIRCAEGVYIGQTVTPVEARLRAHWACRHRPKNGLHRAMASAASVERFCLRVVASAACQCAILMLEREVIRQAVRDGERVLNTDIPGPVEHRSFECWCGARASLSEPRLPSRPLRRPGGDKPDSALSKCTRVRRRKWDALSRA